ncbi:extracellular catalytic domain type 1 short-chain-length polyhydroxyalkanoate depolymerase [Paraburkholderia sp. GAS334]|uniref:extracellular catalytic domain type 1 short-chain-length polyhydroxyalkanoate depolymerase n=1 Tax=Paraburkholderia sp. GAS334 TaxID=3035131 RepID=UPI003D231CDA
MKLKEGFLHAMHDAMTLLRSHGVAEATEAIQRALRGETAEAAHTADATVRPNSEARHTIFPFADVFGAGSAAGAADAKARTDTKDESATRESRHARETRTEAEDRGHFSTYMYANAAGRRRYRLYVPSGAAGDPLPLIVMLHGCTQDADDFAAGTQMNALAERQRCLVAYPVQPRQANPSKCWNWFRPDDQHRERGEPSLIAGITREIVATHNVDPARVYIAGMSAGGAMAAIMVDAYPELYAAAGVHSGLPAGAAHDLPSALAAMKGGRRAGAGRRAAKEMHAVHAPAAHRPLIVFHGDADATVHVVNGQRILHGFEPRPDASAQRTSIPGRRASTVTRLVSNDGIDAELWTVHGAPHAWSGGSSLGSYTDPDGPDASAEMLRFFLDHPQRH